MDNSIAGRVADVHHLLPLSDLSIVAEYFHPIRFDLMALPGVDVADIRSVRSHVHALAQCREIIDAHGWSATVTQDTAGAAREIAELGDASQAALAPPLAAELYGLSVLKESVEDRADNVTRFLTLAREPSVPPWTGQKTMTTLFFEVRNIPSSLYKALGGFATNGINLTKIESYQSANFQVSEFYVDFEGHPDDPRVALTLEELAFFSTQVRNLGVYPAHPYRNAG